MAAIPLTVRGAERLKQELHRLKTVERPAVINAIADARAQGDLSENAEYDAAKEKQGFIEGRIQELEAKLSNAQIIDPVELDADGRIVFGATVDLEDLESSDRVTYQVVGDDEADIRSNLISVSSPIARALIGKSAGDVAEDGVQTAIGQLSKTDPDIGDTHVWAAADAGSGPGVGTYGTLTVDATGKWTYVLDNAKAQAIPKDQTVQDTIMVRVTDAAGATAEQLVTITITGENDFPTILGSSTLGGAVTELPDGDPDENSHTHSVTGKIDFSDVDTLVSADTHTVQSITPQGAGYLGNLVLGTVDDAAGTVGWTFEVEDSAIDHLALGDVLTQSYDVVISDGHGGTAVTTVTVTITGANDDPVIDGAASDLSVTVTEIADGAADENTHVHGHQGYVEFSDVDTRDAVHTVSFVPQGGGAGYLGDFTLSPVDNVNDRVRWRKTTSPWARRAFRSFRTCWPMTTTSTTATRRAGR